MGGGMAFSERGLREFWEEQVSSVPNWLPFQVEFGGRRWVSAQYGLLCQTFENLFSSLFHRSSNFYAQHTPWRKALSESRANRREGENRGKSGRTVTANWHPVEYNLQWLWPLTSGKAQLFHRTKSTGTPREMENYYNNYYQNFSNSSSLGFSDLIYFKIDRKIPFFF